MDGLPSVTAFRDGGSTYLHSRHVESDEAWDAGHVHVVRGDVGVRGGATLTISPGATVSFEAGAELDPGYGGLGTLLARGEPDSPVTFTSAAASPSAGAWGGLRFYSGKNHVLTHCRVSWAGEGGSAAVDVRSEAGLAIADSRIDHARGDGLVLSAGATLVSYARNAFLDNTGFPITLGPDHVGLLDGRGSTFSGSGKPAIRLQRGHVTRSATWRDPGLPYLLQGDTYVNNNAHLTLEPGLILAFDAGAELDVGYGGNGTLEARGTAEAPIRFTSAAASPSAGAWEGLKFYSGRNHVLDFCTASWGGGSSRAGLDVLGSSAIALSDSIVEGSAGNGIRLESGAAFTKFARNTVKGCAKAPVTLSPDQVRFLDPGVSRFAGNGADEIALGHGHIVTSATWRDPGVPFHFGSYEVYVKDNAAWEVGPGVQMRFDAGGGIWVGYGGNGTLVASGSASALVVLGSAATSPSPGDWQGLHIYSGTSTLSGVQILHGGKGGGANLEVHSGARAKLASCSFLSSVGWGLWVRSGGAVEPAQGAGSLFTGNLEGDIRQD